MADETKGRTRPSRKADAAETAGKPSNGRKTRTVASKFPVFYEDENGVLTPMGSFKGKKPEEALQTYIDALEGDRAEAIEASTYAVETNKGIVRLAVAERRELDITRR